MAEFKYWAFLSYSHQDAKWGDWLHKALETYRVPRRLVGKQSRDGRVPDRLYPIFRDREELSVSADLAANLDEALRESRYLIVICSPHAAQSHWVDQEIIEFKKLGREDRILALIVAGEPNATDGKPGFVPEDECFPEPMRYRLAANGELSTDPTEPLAADVREGKDGKDNAKLKLLAGLLGVNYDDLRQREHERRLRRARIIGATGLALAAVLAALTGWALFAERRTAAQKRKTQQLLVASDSARAKESFDRGDAASALVFLARAAEIDPDTRSVPAERLWFALTERSWPLPTSTIMRHHDTILSTTMSVDGKLIATGSKDLTACVWEAETGRLIAATPKCRKLNTKTNGVRVVCFKPGDNRALLTGCIDGTLTLWHCDGKEATVVWTADHGNEITSAAFSPSGQFVATGCRDGKTRVWSGENGEKIWEFPGKENVNVHTLLFPPDSDDTFLTLSGNTARLLQISQRKELHAWTHRGDINTAAFTADGKLVATAGDAPGVQIWNVDNGEEVGKPIPHEREVTDLRFAPDGQSLVTVSGGKVYDWKLDGSPALEPPLAIRGSASSVRFSPDGLRIYTGTDDGRVQAWSALDGASLGEPVREWAQIIAMLPQPDNLHLIVVTQEGAVRNWLMPTLLPRSVQLHHPGPVEMMSATADGHWIVTACQDGKARIWNGNGKLNEPIVIDSSGKVVSVAISAKGTYVATGGWDAFLRIWKVSDQTLIGGHAIKFDSTVRNVSFSPGEDVIAAGSEGGILRIYRLPDLVKPLWEQTEHKDGVHALRFDRNGGRLASGWNGGTIEVVQISAAQSCERIGSPIVAAQELTAIDLSPSGKLLLSGDGEGVVQMWSADTHQKHGPPARHKAAVQAVTFSPNEHFFVSGSDDDTAVIWNTATGKPIVAALVHSKPICSLAVSPDSTRVATGTEDGAAQVWEVAAGESVSEPLLHNDAIRGLSFTYDGAKLASASSDGTVYITDVSTPLSASDYRFLAQFGRSLSSVSLDASSRLAWREVPPVTQLQKVCMEKGGMDVFCRWFFAGRTQRSLTPFAITTVADQVLETARHRQPDSLRSALLPAAGDPDLSRKVLANRR
jgi:WD40 repeat protein